MRKNIKVLSAVILATVLAAGTLTACTPPLEGTVLADFSEGAAETFFESDGWTNGDVFNVAWRKQNVTYKDGAMHLGISENPDGSMETNDGYFAGEARSYQYFGYGDYSVKMKPAKKDGTASTFFTCTGPYDENEEGEPNPHDEIDIEFLGSDTTKVQFNYFVNGVGEHEYKYDLGFDASEEYHEYGYRWTSEYIEWFVDGEPVYKVTATESTPLPTTPGRILMNYWCGTEEAEGWMGKYELDSSITCEYKSVKTTATPIGELPEKVDVEKFEGDWSAIDAVETGFTSAVDAYTIVNDGTTTDVTYTEVVGNSYNNVNMNVADVAAEKNWVHAVLVNNGEKEVKFRFNVVSGGDKVYALNSYALVNGELVTNMPFEGTVITVPAGERVEIEVSYKGVANTIEFMLDSIHTSDTAKAGDVTISDIKFAKQGDIIIPELPEDDNNGVDIDGTTVKFTSGPAYVISTDADTNSMNVVYSDMAGATYANVAGNVVELAAGKNTLTVTFKNNGDTAVTVRTDLIGETKVGNTDVCNVSATADGGTALYTDIEWGGTTVVVAAGETVTLTVTYDGQSERGAIQRLQFYFDSSVYGDTDMHSGNVTISGISFSNVEVTAPETDGNNQTDNGADAE